MVIFARNLTLFNFILGILTKPINRFGLETPPNEDNANLDYSEIDYFDNVNFEKFLNNSLTMNSNPSITNQPNSCVLNHSATDPTCSQKFNDKSSPKRQITVCFQKNFKFLKLQL